LARFAVEGEQGVAERPDDLPVHVPEKPRSRTIGVSS
jgi:hypothetical protein